MLSGPSDSFHPSPASVSPTRSVASSPPHPRSPQGPDDIDSRDSLDELSRWVWVLGSERNELTTAGHCHAGAVVGGLAERWLSHLGAARAGTTSIGQAAPNNWVFGTMDLSVIHRQGNEAPARP